MSNYQKQLEHYFDKLWPLNRSITGPGYRKSLDILSGIMPTERLKFESGQKVFDWTVPEEWVVNNAYIIDPSGKKYADFKKNNLHVVGYSEPINEKISLKELKEHLYTLPDKPEAIPYVVSYYNKTWGFCIPYNDYVKLSEGEYKVYIDSKHYPGHVECGEAVLQGETDEEIFLSTYLCHPSMANNELSGPLVMAFLFDKLSKLPRRRYTYRFVIVPETIGAICYLTKRGKHLKQKMVAGYQMTCLGDNGCFTYKYSRDSNTLADRAVLIVLKDHEKYKTYPFNPGDGTDERQYCSPGFNLPVGSLMRTPYAKYEEYHTSLDNKDFISFDAIERSIDTYFQVIKTLEYNITWLRTMPYCEPQLGKRGLYPSVSSEFRLEDLLEARMWILNLADGKYDLIEIAEKSNFSIELLIENANILFNAGLIKPADCLSPIFS